MENKTKVNPIDINLPEKDPDLDLKGKMIKSPKNKAILN